MTRDREESEREEIRSYELMASYWPTASPETDDPRIIEAMNNSPKIVFSKTLKRADWQNLAPKGLVDDYRIFVVPLVLGSGKPLFREVKSRIQLKLLETKSFGTGMVELRYSN